MNPIRYDSGEKKAWSAVHVPKLTEVDKRHLHRRLTIFKADRTRLRNRIKGLLVGQGVCLEVKADFLARLGQTSNAVDLITYP